MAAPNPREQRREHAGRGADARVPSALSVYGASRTPAFWRGMALPIAQGHFDSAER